MAARKGSMGIVRKLVQHGASVNLANKVNKISIQSVSTVTCHSNMSRDCSCFSYLTGIGVG